jgi:hypothetical protein
MSTPFNQGAPTVPVVLNTSNCFVFGNTASGNALSVQQLGTGNVASFRTTTGATAMFVNAAGNVGVGQTNPQTPLHVTASASNSAILIDNSAVSMSVRPIATNAGSANCHIWADGAANGLADAGFLRIAAGGGTSTVQKSYIDISGYSPVTDLHQNIVLGTAGTERMRINNVGNVGIGTSSPGNTFQVGAAVDGIYANNPLSQSNVIIFGNSPFKPSYTGTGGGGTLFINSTNANASNVGASIALGGRGYDFGGGQQHMTLARIQGVYTVGSAYNGEFVIETQNSGALYERMRINNVGNVGIGTTNPIDPLHVQSTTATTRLTGTTNFTTSAFIFDNRLGAYWHLNGYGNNPTTSARGAAYAAGQIICGSETNNNYENSYMAFQVCYDPQSDGTGGLGVTTERMRIKSNGNVGIGTTSPGYLLELAGINGGANSTALKSPHFFSNTYTTGAVINGASTTISPNALGNFGGQFLYWVNTTTTGQYYSMGVAYTWNPDLQSVNQLLTSGVTTSVSASKLQITNTSGGTLTFYVRILNLASNVT